MKTSKLHGGQYEIQTLQTSRLTSRELNEVVEKIKEPFLWFAPESTEASMRNRLCQHPDAYVDILVDLKTDKCSGFSVYYTDLVCGQRVIFRGGTVVVDRSRGLYKELLSSSISSDKHDFVVAMTQNPRVYVALRSFSSTETAYPAMGIEVPNEVRAIAATLCKAPGIDLDTMIVPDVYAGICKDSSFKTIRDSSVEKFFTDSLGENDGFFVIVPLS